MGKDAMKNQLVYYIIAAVTILIYGYLTFFSPQDASAQTFGLTQTQIFFLKVSFMIPYVLTWVLAMYGLATLDAYISLAKEKNTIVTPLLSSFRSGLIWIVFGTIFVALIGGIRSYVMSDASLLPIFAIVTNYFYVFPSLIGFIIIFLGVRRLRASDDMKEHKKGGYILNTILVSVISLVYLFLLFTNPTRQFSPNSAIQPTYYLPDVMIILTIVLPIAITWWLGFYAAFTLGDLVPYLTHAEFFKGISRIVYGIWSIIFTSIIIQALLSLGGTRLLALGLTILLVIIYIFVLLQGLGYFFIALGSNTLRRSLTENSNG